MNLAVAKGLDALVKAISIDALMCGFCVLGSLCRGITKKMKDDAIFVDARWSKPVHNDHHLSMKRLDMC